MKREKNILAAFLLNLAFSLFEFAGGIFTGSVAILSDAIHDMGDAVAIGFAFLLEKKSRKKADGIYTFGYGRYSVLGGAVVTLILLLGSAAVNVLFSLAGSYPVLLMLWCLNGCFQSMIWTPIVRIMATEYQDSIRPRAMFAVSMTLIVGYLAAWALSGLLTSQFSWRWAFIMVWSEMKGTPNINLALLLAYFENSYGSEREKSQVKKDVVFLFEYFMKTVSVY